MQQDGEERSEGRERDRADDPFFIESARCVDPWLVAAAPTRALSLRSEKGPAPARAARGVGAKIQRNRSRARCSRGEARRCCGSTNSNDAGRHWTSPLKKDWMNSGLFTCWRSARPILLSRPSPSHCARRRAPATHIRHPAQRAAQIPGPCALMSSRTRFAATQEVPLTSEFQWIVSSRTPRARGKTNHRATLRK